MKKSFLLLMASLLMFSGLRAQTLTISGDGKTATVTGSTAGCIAGTAVISAAQRTTITSLTVASGNMDATDFKILRDNFTVLENLDISAVNVSEYTGTAGTISTASQLYAANKVPSYSFATSGGGKLTLKSLNLPLTATAFGDYLFSNCTNLSSIHAGPALATISSVTFNKCPAIVSIDPANTSLSSDVTYGVIYSLTGGVKTAIVAASTSPALNSLDFVVPSTVTSVGASAFLGNNLHSVTFNATTTIGNQAFESSNNVNVAIGPNVTLGTSVFLNSQAIVNVDPASTKYASDTDYGILYTLTGGVKTIIYSASSSPSFSTKDYTMPATVTTINSYAFHTNYLKSVTLTGVTTLYANAFYNGNNQTITVDSKITSMGQYAFSGNRMSTINLSQLTVLSNYAFNGCTNLTNVVIPASVTTFQAAVFQGCTLLNTVTFPSGITSIGNQTFYNCTALNTVNLPATLTTLGNLVFQNCTSLSAVTIPASVTTIGTTPFLNCSALVTVDASNPNYSSDANGVFYNKAYTNLISFPVSITGSFTVPSTVTTISASAFYYTKLTSVTIPASVTSIGAGAFNNIAAANLTQLHMQSGTPCTLGATVFSGLTAAKFVIYVPDWTAATTYGATAQWSTYGIVRDIPVSINLATKGTLTSLLTTGEKNNLTTLTVSGVMDATDFKVIYGMAKLTSVDLGGVTSIETYTGTGGPNTASTVYPANELPQYSFNGKTLITSVVLPGCLTSIGQYAFKGTALSSLSLSDAITSVGAYCFNACTALQAIHLPAGLTIINNNLFNGCTSLTTVNIPDNVQTIDASAFNGCISLENSILPVGLKTIAASAFSGTSKLNNLVIPASVTSLGASAFSGCSALQSITIPAGVTALTGNTFLNCIALKDVTFASSTAMTSLGSNEFSGCSSLVRIALPVNIQALPAGLFSNATALKSVVLPDKLNSFTYAAFTGCTSLDSVYMKPGNLFYSEINGALYNVSGSTLVFCPMGRKSFVIPSVVTAVGSYAFANNTQINQVDFSASDVTSIGYYAFQNCTGLSTIQLPATLSTITCGNGGSPFIGCPNLKITFEPGAKLTNVDDVIFTSDMKTLVFCKQNKVGDYVVPDGVTLIGDGAFCTCPNISSISMTSSVQKLGAWTFLGCSGLTSIKLSNSLKELPWQCMFGCPLLKSVVVPDGVTLLEQGVFYNDYALESVTLPEGLIRISHYVFQNCRIPYMKLPKALKSLGVAALGNDYLLHVEFPEGFEKFDGDNLFWNQVRTIKMNNPNPIDITTTPNFANATNKANAVLIVPVGSKAKYAAAPGWSGFKNIVEEGSSDLIVTSVPGGLSNAIRALGSDIANVTRMKVLGHINAIDFKMVRDSMRLLADVDFSEAIVDAIPVATTLGTNTSSVVYQSNTVPTYAFLGLKRIMNSIVLPNTVTTIDAGVFTSARGISKVKIPASVTSMSFPMNYDNNIVYEIDPANSAYVSDGKAIFTKDMKTLCCFYPSVTGSYSIPESVTTVSGYAFWATQLTQVTIPANTSINNYYVFANAKIKSYVSRKPVPSGLNTGYAIFASTDASSLVYVPAGSKSTYLAATVWKDFGSARIVEMSTCEKTIVPGALKDSLASLDKSGIVRLKLNGQMDARDFKYIRDSLPQMTSLDLSNVSIAELKSSLDGTAGAVVTDYAANEIPLYALKNATRIDSVYLPASVTSIAQGGFQGCQRLSYINLQAGIVSLGDYAFNGCAKLQTVSTPLVTRLGAYVFSGCQILNDVNFPQLAEMGVHSFENCISLNAFAVPAGIHAIPAYSFSGCTQLASVSGAGLTEIAKEAFSGCSALKTIDISGVTSLGNGAFMGCKVLSSLLTVPGVSVVADNAFSGCIGVTSLVIPTSVKTLAAYSFKNCIGLTTVTIPKEVEYIAPTAFEGCVNLNLVFEDGGHYYADADGVVFTSSERKTLVSCPANKAGAYTIPSSVTSMLPGAFAGCSKLTAVTFPASLTAIPDSAFMECTVLENLNFAEGLVTVGKSAFLYCQNLVSVKFPSTVTSVGASAFENCGKLEDVQLPSGVTTISNRLFYKCWRLLNFKIPNTVTTIEAEAFAGHMVGWGVSLGNLLMPQSVTTLQQGAFRSSLLNSIRMENPVPLTFTEGDVFNGVDKSIPLYVPVGSAAAYRAADQWKDFTYILEPREMTVDVTAGQLTTILTSADKLQLTKLKLRGTMDATDFQCLKTETVGLLDLDFSEVNIVAYTGTNGTNGATSQTYPADVLPVASMLPRYASIILPANLTGIGDNAFSNCALITNIVLPNTLQTIGSSAFYGCSRLNSMLIPSTVTTIGQAAFANCSSLSSITIPEGTSTLGNSTFQNCIGLKTVGLPSTISSIGASAFMSCEKLKTILIYANVGSIGGYAFANCAGLDTIYTKPVTPIALGTNAGATPYVFYGCKPTCTLRVPEGAKPAYLLADQWKEFGDPNIIEEVWYGKTVWFSFSGYTPVVTRKSDGKVLASGAKVEDGSIVVVAGNYPAHSVQTLRSNVVGSNVYTYYKPTTETVSGASTDITVTDHLSLNGVASSSATWTGLVSSGWEVSDNWSSHYVPTGFNNVTVKNASNPATAGDSSVCYNMLIESGSVVVPPAKMLTVFGSIDNKAGSDGLLVKADENAVLVNGSLIFHNPADKTVSGTVEMYSKSTTNTSNAQGGKYKWQHFGIPVRSMTTEPVFGGAFVREYKENGATMAEQWDMKYDADSLFAFHGYEVAPSATQSNGKLYTFKGILENRTYRSGLLNYTEGALDKGFNLLANPYTSAVRMSDVKYGADMLQTVYLYSTGSLNDWTAWTAGTPRDTTNADVSGQYVAVPKALAGLSGLPSTIPSMQAFMVRAMSNLADTICIPYAQAVGKNIEKQRAPRRVDNALNVCTRILVKGESNKADCMWLFTRPSCSKAFDNGFDGEKISGSANAPQLFAKEGNVRYQVDAVSDVNHTLLGFVPGSDVQYTLTFVHDNVSAVYEKLYLLDRATQQVTDITQSGTEYSFNVTGYAEDRFEILTSYNQQDVVDKTVSEVKIKASGHTISVYNPANEEGTLQIYDLNGKHLSDCVFQANQTTVISAQLNAGVYLVKTQMKTVSNVVDRIVITDKN